MFFPSSLSALHLPSSHGSERSVSPSPPSPSSSPSRLHSQQSLCSSWEQGRCTRGSQCQYLHLGNYSAAPPLVTSSTFPSFPVFSSSASSSSSPSSSGAFSSQLYNSLFSSSAASPVSSYAQQQAFDALDELQLDGGASSVSSSKYPQQQQHYPQYPQQHRQQYDGGRQQQPQQQHDAHYGSSNGSGNGLNSLMLGSMGMQALSFGMMHGGGYAHHSGGLGGGVKKECWDWLAGRCTRGVMCKYAHANQQQLSMQAAGAGGGVGGLSGLKLGQNDNVCHQWTRSGQCQYGDVCKFAHVTQQMGPGAFASRQQHQLGASDYAAEDEHPTYPSFSAATPLSSALGSSTSSAVSSSSSSHFLFHKDSSAAPNSSSSSGSSPPLVFRDSRLGLDTEVCRFYAKHTRCKYSSACKFVHVHHGAVGGMQVSGVNVTIGELQRLCALHVPAAILALGGAPLSGLGLMGGKSSSSSSLSLGAGGGQQLVGQTAAAASGAAGSQGSSGYGKEYAAFDRESRELREMGEMKGLRELKAQQRRLGSLLLNGSAASPTSSASAPASASSSPQSFRDPLAIQTTKSTPTLGGGLNGSISPSLLQLSQQRQSTDSKTIGSSSSTGYMSPLTFPAASPAAAASLRHSSAESAASGSGSSFPSSTSASSFQLARPVARSALSFHQQSASSDLTDFHLPPSSTSAGYLDDDDAMLIAGSTYAALNGSGALADEADADTRRLRQDSSSSPHDGSSSQLRCHHCAIKGSVYHDSYSNLCDDCYTALLR